MKKTLTIVFAVVFSSSVFGQTGMGIGNTNPQEKLDVTGAIKIGTTSTSNAGTIRWNGTNFQGYDGSQWVNLDSQGGADADWTVSGVNQYSAVTGNVGIGVTSPAYKLDVQTSARIGKAEVGDWGSNFAYFGNQALTHPAQTNFALLQSSSGRTILNSASGQSIYFSIGNTPHMYMEPGGNVGIGVISPTYQLDVQTSARIGKAETGDWGSNFAYFGNQALTQPGQTNFALLQSSVGKTTLNGASGQSISFNIGNTPYMYMNSSGNVGIGTIAPGYQLDVQASARIGKAEVGHWGSNFAYFGNQALTQPAQSNFALLQSNVGKTTLNSASGQPILFSIGNTTHMYLSSSGNVGIGTISPTTDLEVAGQVKITGGTPGIDKVLRSDANGLATWVDPNSLVSADGDWTINGSNQYSTVAGNVGIGVSAPSAKLHIQQSSGSSIMLSRGDANTTDGEVMGEILFDNTSNTTVSTLDAAAVIRSTASGTQGNSNKGGNILFLTKNNVPGSSAATERLRITAAGNIGIGTTSPAAKLDINGTGALNDNQLRLRGGSDGNHYLSYIGGSFDGAKLTGNNNVILNTVTGGDALIVTGSRVGIGTSSPIAPLHVESQANPSYGNFTYYAFETNAGTGSCCGGTVNGVSIHASGRVMASEFDAFSDARIKNVIGISESKKDLETLASIEITDYRMIDKMKDVKPFKKVIAQQVEEVYPQAVSTITEVIPDIYTVASANDGFIDISANVKAGDRIKLIRESGNEMVTVTKVSEEGFFIDRKITEDVFVYGREVDDFHTVDYEAIAMLNVSATQELYRMIKKLQDENSELRSSVNEFNAMAKEIEQLKQWTNYQQQSNK
ncbi:MAG: hypothetical protein GC178_13310 [Flavobacteriales bacterium]|nr:hypothetical protein [Flavobacteriales bacterium]